VQPTRSNEAFDAGKSPSSARERGLTDEQIAQVRREFERRIGELDLRLPGGPLPPPDWRTSIASRLLEWTVARPRRFRTAGVLFRVGFFAFCTVLGYYGVWIGGTHLSSVPHYGGLRGVLYGGGCALFVLGFVEISMRRRRRYS
jgi:hypothetical protein